MSNYFFYNKKSLYTKDFIIYIFGLVLLNGVNISMQRVIQALYVLLGKKVAVNKRTLKDIYKLIPMTPETKDKLTAVKNYLVTLPAKFKALQDQIDALKGNDDVDKAKIDALTAEVDALKQDQVDIVAIADELDAAAKAADEADGVEAAPVE